MNKPALAPDTNDVLPAAQTLPANQPNPVRMLVIAATLLIAAAAALGYWRAMSSGLVAANPTPGGSPQQVATINSEAGDSQAKPEQTKTATAPVWPMWEFRLREPIPPRDEPLTPLPWRLIGASGSSGAWHLIVLRQGKTDPEYFRVGDKLPGNYRIEAITEEDVTLKHGRRVLVLSYIGSR